MEFAARPQDTRPIATTIDAADMGPTLHVELQTLGTTCRLTLQGDLNATNLAVLEAQFDSLGRIPCHDVVVDLRFLTGLDAVGANVLLGLYYYVIARGGVFRITGAVDEISALLRSVGDEMMQPPTSQFDEPNVGNNAVTGSDGSRLIHVTMRGAGDVGDVGTVGDRRGSGTRCPDRTF
jgi:anti-anti-sigma regulatory factor